MDYNYIAYAEGFRYSYYDENEEVLYYFKTEKQAEKFVRRIGGDVWDILIVVGEEIE